MKRFLILSLSVNLLIRCSDSGNIISSSKGSKPLHFNLTTSHVTEPVGLLNYDGYYHLFYITSEESKFHKTNSIGHSISNDLINWTESSKSVFTEYNNSILKGGIVFDSNNITGYGTDKNPPLIAVLTRTEITDSTSEDIKKVLPVLAYSTDGGDSWKVTTDKISFPESFIKNPQNVGIVWHETTKKWIMSIALSNHVQFYSSPDLRLWNFESLIGSDFFPEEIEWVRSTLFPLSDEFHWVLTADIKNTGNEKSSGGTVYFIGYFDGHNFINQSSLLHWLDYGQNIYGSLISIGKDDRRINIGWVKNDNIDGQFKKAGNNGSGIITLPRELSLGNMNGEWFISMSPLTELKEIYGKETQLGLLKVSYKVDDLELISNLKVPVELILKFNTSNIQKGSFPIHFGVKFWNKRGKDLTFGYDRFGYYYIDKSGLVPSSGTQISEDLIKMPCDHSDSTMSIRFIIDISAIECFAEDGKLVMTHSFSSEERFNRITLFTEKGNIDLLEGKIVRLKTILN